MSAITPLAATAGGTATPETGNTRATLGQDSFLALLTAQLRNQNPLDPLQNSEFIGQMAQFSTVTGINRINDTLDRLSTGATGISAVAPLIGRQDLVPSPQTRADASGTLAGRLTLDTEATALTVTYSDAETGSVLHSQALGPAEAGDTAFVWSDPSLAGRRITVSAEANTSGGALRLLPSTYARVIGGTPATSTEPMMLDVEDHGPIPALSVPSLR